MSEIEKCRHGCWWDNTGPDCNYLDNCPIHSFGGVSDEETKQVETVKVVAKNQSDLERDKLIAASNADKQPKLGKDVSALRDLITKFVNGTYDEKSVRGFAIQWCIIPDPDLEYKLASLELEQAKAIMAAAEEKMKKLKRV